MDNTRLLARARRVALSTPKPGEPGMQLFQERGDAMNRSRPQQHPAYARQGLQQEGSGSVAVHCGAQSLGEPKRSAEMERHR